MPPVSCNNSRAAIASRSSRERLYVTMRAPSGRVASIFDLRRVFLASRSRARVADTFRGDRGGAARGCRTRMRATPRRNPADRAITKESDSDAPADLERAAAPQVLALQKNTPRPARSPTLREVITGVRRASGLIRPAASRTGWERWLAS